MREGGGQGQGQGWAYLITGIEVLVKRVFASFEAPSGPILFLSTLTGKDDKRRRRTGTRTGMGILDMCNRGAGQEGLCELRGSFIADVFVA
jgi:hypothetical protein